MNHRTPAEDIRAENTRLGEEIAALRDFIAAVAAGRQPHPADSADMERYYQAGSDRFRLAAYAAEQLTSHPGAIHAHAQAAMLRREYAVPLGYAAEPDVIAGDFGPETVNGGTS